jgi:hypothetical protein
MSGVGHFPPSWYSATLDTNIHPHFSQIALPGACYAMMSTGSQGTEIMKTLLDLSSRFPIARWSPIPLRLIVGYGFMQHGVAKLSKGPDCQIHLARHILERRA